MPTFHFRHCYDAGAKGYVTAHARWLRHAGGEAQCAFEGAVTALLKPGDRMLDAACGTGTVLRRVLMETTGDVDLTLLDKSSRMLAQCEDIPAKRVLGCLTSLPFNTNEFDLVTCAWGIDVLDDARPALHEFVRVTRPKGHICLVFCADRPVQSLLGLTLRGHVSRSGRGRFLDHNRLRSFATTAGVRCVQTLYCSGPAAAMILHV